MLDRSSDVVRSVLLQLDLKAALWGSDRPQQLCMRQDPFLVNIARITFAKSDKKNTHFRFTNELRCEHITV